VLRVPPAVASLQYTILVFSGCSSRPRPEPFGNGGPQVVGLFLSVAVRDNVVA